jgi:C-terminal processing protease CtpA/Prc
MMIYGEIDPGVGYVSLFGEFGHAATARACAALDLPRPRLEAASFLADEIAAIEQSLDEVAHAFADMRAVIVDARLNYGGYDRIALEFAGLFTDRRRIAYRKKAWTGNGFTSSQSIEIAPRKHSLSHLPVCLLTSRQTASAGEILVLGMMSCPNVTRVGEATLGILSDNLYKPLPIGWEVSLSNEIYEAPDGALYEAVGIPPQVETPVFDPADVRAGLRAAVDRAREIIPTRLAP